MTDSRGQSDPWTEPTPQQQQPAADQPPAWPAAPGPQWGAPPGPPPPQWPGYYQPARTTNGLAIASMVLGILWLYWIGSVLALVFGYVARSQIKERGQSGDGMAIAGIVLGWVGLGVGLLFFLVLAAAVGSSSP